MARKKPAAAVYRDESVNEDDDDLPPPRKKSRLAGEPLVAVAVPRIRRAALTEKNTNPSSSDNSFLRPIEQPEKPQRFKRKAPSDSETIKVPNPSKCRTRLGFCGTMLIPVGLPSTKDPSAGRVCSWKFSASSTEGAIINQGS